MEAVLHFLGEYVGGIDTAENEGHLDAFGGDVFFGGCFSKIKILHILANRVRCPFYRCLVITELRSWEVCVREQEIGGFMAKGDGSFRAFVSGNDLISGTAACTLFLANDFPGNEPTHVHDEVATHGTEFKKMNFSAFGDCVTDLSTPAHIRV